MNLSQNFQNMNKKLFFLPALLLGALLMFAPGCGEDDPCQDVSCGNGVCIDGSCDCDTGYELGASGECDTEMRIKFLGTYSCSDDCVPGASWSSTITASANAINKVVISNFANSGQNVTCTVDGTSIVADAGSITDADGTISGTTLTMTFDNPAPPPTSCTMTMIKQ
jgi:hypothetical protein